MKSPARLREPWRGGANLLFPAFEPVPSQFTRLLCRSLWQAPAVVETPRRRYNRMKTFASAILLLLLPSVSGCRQQVAVRAANPTAVWITGFYGAVNGAEPISEIPWGKITHVDHFAAAPGVDVRGDGNGTVELHYLTDPEIKQIVAAAHRAGKKAIVTIKDNDHDPSAFSQSTSPGLIAIFVANIASFVNRNGYDGVDFDWETNVNVAQYEDLLGRVRTAFGSTKLILTEMGNWSGLEQVAASSYPSIDQINLMCYDMDGPANGYSWYNDALFQAGNSSLMTCDWRVRAFTTAGVPAGKIGIGIPFYGRRWAGVTQALVNGTFTAGSTVFYRNLASDKARWQPQYQFYDAVHKSDYLSIPLLHEFDSYNGVQSIKDVVAWQKSEGFGGFMTFTLEYEYLSFRAGDARYPLSVTLCQEVFGRCP